MFERVQLGNWGPFHGHEIPFDAPIVDLCADNGAGKSTILDAIATVIGCNVFAHDQRDVANYQTDGTKPAYVALTVRNHHTSASRRAFSGYGDQLTILCKVDAAAGRLRSYFILDGDVGLANAITATSRRGTQWMGLSDYNDVWERAGYPLKDRQNRMFSNLRPNEVVKSKPRGLFELFQNLASNPTINQKLKEARMEKEKVDADLRVMESNQIQYKAAALNKQTEVKGAFEVMEAAASLITEERLLMVAEYDEARVAAERESERLGDAARLRPQLETKKAHEKLNLGRAHKQQLVAEEQVRAYTRQRDEHNKFVEQMQHEAQAAYHKAEVARAEQAEYDTYATLAETRDLVAERTVLLRRSDEANRAIGLLESQQKEIAHRIATWSEHGVPVHIQEAVAELKDIHVTPAWTFLAKDQDQTFEDALGPVRFGILVAPADVDRVAKIMAPHRYPGPISTLSPKEYTRLASEGWKPNKHGRQTPFGIFVAQDVEPVLNEALKEASLRRLQHEERDAKRRHTELDALLQALRTQLDDMEKLLQKARRRDDLRGRKNSWKALIDESDVLQRNLEKRRAMLMEASSNLQRANVERDAAVSMAAASEAAIKELEQQLANLKDGGRLSKLQQEAAAKLEACKEFLEQYKDRAQPPDLHRKRIRSLHETLAGKTPLSSAQYAQLVKEAQALLKDERTEQERLAEKRDNQVKAARNLQQLEEEQQRHIETEFRRAKARIEALADGLDFKVKMGLDRRDGNWIIEYKVRFGHHTGWEFLNSGKMSSGQEQMAAFAFCLGLTNDQHVAWYCLDEPSKNFDYRNTTHLFQILKLAKAQIIMTSAKDLDYPPGVKVARYYLPPITNDRKAPPIERLRVDMPEIQA